MKRRAAPCSANVRGSAEAANDSCILKIQSSYFDFERAMCRLRTALLVLGIADILSENAGRSGKGFPPRKSHRMFLVSTHCQSGLGTRGEPLTGISDHGPQHTTTAYLGQPAWSNARYEMVQLNGERALLRYSTRGKCGISRRLGS